MEYTGKELYALYRQAHAQMGCATDEWEDLEGTERDAWNLVAMSLMEQ